jgi:predicted dehydrogenase
VEELLAEGYLGQLREFVVLGTHDQLLDSSAPLHWRQSAEYSGHNMLALGILQETLIRWIPDPARVFATTGTYTKQRRDPRTGRAADVETPDSVHALAELPDGARGIYHLSGALCQGPGFQIQLYGSAGTLKYLLAPADRLLGARPDDGELREIEVPPEKAGSWQVEADFARAIRGGPRPQLTDFRTGVRYMEFTEAVAHSAATGLVAELSQLPTPSKR